MTKKVCSYLAISLLFIAFSSEYNSAEPENKHNKNRYTHVRRNNQTRAVVPTEKKSYAVSATMLHRLKDDFVTYVQGLQRKAGWAQWSPSEALLRAFGGRFATFEEISVLDRLFKNQQLVQRALIQLGKTEIDVQDINDILNGIKSFKGLPKIELKDRLIELIHPKNMARIGLPENTCRSEFIQKAKDPAIISDESYFKGMVFSLYVIYLVEEKNILERI